MLILTRKPGERIFIGPDVVVSVVQVQGSQVRIGIDAPTDIRVDREEVHLRRLNQAREDQTDLDFEPDAPNGC